LDICKFVKKYLAQEETVGNNGLNKVQKQIYVPVKQQGKSIQNPIVLGNIRKDDIENQLKVVTPTGIAGNSGCQHSNRFQTLEDTDYTQATLAENMKEQDLQLE